jgi:hypothetical protein
MMILKAEREKEREKEREVGELWKRTKEKSSRVPFSGWFCVQKKNFGRKKKQKKKNLISSLLRFLSIE